MSDPDTLHMPSSTPMVETPRIGIVIATAGRAAELWQAIELYDAQAIRPEIIVVSAIQESDVGAARMHPRVEVILGPAGSCVQRNRALDALAGRCDLVCIFDDDYLPSARTLADIVAFFAEHPDIVGASGHLIADGIHGAGLSYEETLRLLAEYDARPRSNAYSIVPALTGLYGCNMVFRMSAVGAVRFDEALPLYGWQEDIDFATRVAQAGRVVHTNAFAGVHRGVKKGRSSGLRVGYSQIANPIYLVRKGTMPASFATKLAVKNVAANLVKSLRPEPWLDRRGRVRGNFIALLDLVRGRLRPDRILDLH